MTEESKQALTFYRIDNNAYCRLSRSVLGRYLHEVKAGVLSAGKWIGLTVLGVILLAGLDFLNPVLMLEQIFSQDILSLGGIGLLAILGIFLIKGNASEQFQANGVNRLDAALLLIFSIDIVYLLFSMVTGWGGVDTGDWKIAYEVMVLCLSGVLLFCRIALYGTKTD